ADIERLCGEAAAFGFHAVCVAPVWVAAAARLLPPNVCVCSVAGFPLGSSLPETKADEAAAAIESGAREVDLVMQLGWLREAVPAGGQQPVDEDGLGDVAREIRLVRAAMRAALARTPPEQRLLKVIVETGLLDERQKTVAARVAAEAGADYVKTCTGFLGGGATVADVGLLRSALGGRARIKAAGGIRDRAAALALIEAGADRLGCSASVAIVRSDA
ncbi:MAG TPA: deoxyribose-phosphate aldolase, partial [Planctomycetota bacterium]|nr:deoxyribose-phosphate aldolase [Planctomycetota bacterium]